MKEVIITKDCLFQQQQKTKKQAEKKKNGDWKTHLIYYLQYYQLPSVEKRNSVKKNCLLTHLVKFQYLKKN